MSQTSETPSPQSTAPDQVAATEQTKRMPFYEEAVSHSKDFGHFLLAQVPEINVAAVVPVWGMSDKSLPACIIMGRGERLPLGDLFRLSLSLLDAALATHAQLRERLEETDQHAAQLAKLIHERQQQLEELTAAANRVDPGAGQPAPGAG